MRLSDRHRYSVADRPEGENGSRWLFIAQLRQPPWHERKQAIVWIIRPAGRFVCPLERSIDASVGGCQKVDADYMYMHQPGTYTYEASCLVLFTCTTTVIHDE